MNTALAPGQTVYRDFGPLHIRIDMHEEGVAITITAHPVLDRSFTNLDEGRAYLTFLRDEANAGTPVWQIEQQAGALTSAAAVVDQAEQDMIDGITATLKPASQSSTLQERDDAQQIVADGQGWNRERNAARRLHVTRTQQYLKPPTAAQIRLIRQHRDGIVELDGRANWTCLRAIVDRKLGEVHEVAGRHVITAVRLNARGLAYTEQEEVKAA